MNFDTVDHVLWPFEDEEEIELFDEADMMYAEYKLEKDTSPND